VRDGLKLSKLRAEHAMLTLIELIYVKKKYEKLTLACKGDTLPALLVWFHHNLAGFSNSNNDFERRVVEKCMMAQNACSDTRMCLLGVSLNEIFARNCHLISFFCQGQLNGLLCRHMLFRVGLIGLSGFSFFPSFSSKQ
jgi:hypothetical protein